jgi:hypothetical protein
MKTFLNLVLVGLSLMLAACNKSNDGVDTTKLENSFSSSDPQQKSSVDKVVSSVRAKDYSGAMNELKQLTSNAKLTPEQKQAIEDTLKQLQTEITDTAKKVADDAREGLNKALKK